MPLVPQDVIVALGIAHLERRTIGPAPRFILIVPPPSGLKIKLLRPGDQFFELGIRPSKQDSAPCRAVGRNVLQEVSQEEV